MTTARQAPLCPEWPRKPAKPRRVMLQWGHDAGMVGWLMRCRECGHYGWYGESDAKPPPVPCPICNLHPEPNGQRCPCANCTAARLLDKYGTINDSPPMRAMRARMAMLGTLVQPHRGFRHGRRCRRAP